jgi:hypothetical protein|tara:strand:+ start:743 stop:1036 length:294 start_codon:yes stop_codon:yes gene_type:complete
MSVAQHKRGETKIFFDDEKKKKKDTFDDLYVENNDHPPLPDDFGGSTTRTRRKRRMTFLRADFEFIMAVQLCGKNVKNCSERALSVAARTRQSDDDK